MIGKLALVHAAFELSEVDPEWILEITYVPAPEVDSELRAAFESAPPIEFWPEVGSRSTQRLVEFPELRPTWVTVQPGRYRYLVLPERPPLVRMVLSEYLLCEVVFTEPTDEDDVSAIDRQNPRVPIAKAQLRLPIG